MTNIEQDILRIEKRIEIIPEAGCWIWMGSCNKGGYGRITRGTLKRAKKYVVHRYLYKLLVGDIPEGLQLDHLCRVRCCVNPSHLEVVTPKENTRRGTNYNRDKSVCKKGHQYSEENTYIRKVGMRDCRICRKTRRRSFKERTGR